LLVNDTITSRLVDFICWKCCRTYILLLARCVTPWW